MKTILLILGLAVVGTLWRNHYMKPTVSPMQANEKILAFGDSLTYGYGADAAYSYPAVLSVATGVSVINAGVNGDTSSEGLRRLPALLGDPSIRLMILCFGGNDILQKQPLSALKSNLKSMIDIAQSKNITVILVSVPNISLFGLAPMALYEEVAEESGVPLLSGVLSEILAQPALKSDQIHPNAKGYRILAERIATFLREKALLP